MYYQRQTPIDRFEVAGANFPHIAAKMNKILLISRIEHHRCASQHNHFSLLPQINIQNKQKNTFDNRFKNKNIPKFHRQNCMFSYFANRRHPFVSLLMFSCFFNRCVYADALLRVDDSTQFSYKIFGFIRCIIIVT